MLSILKFTKHIVKKHSNENICSKNLQNISSVHILSFSQTKVSGISNRYTMNKWEINLVLK